MPKAPWSSTAPVMASPTTSASTLSRTKTRCPPSSGTVVPISFAASSYSLILSARVICLLALLIAGLLLLLVIKMIIGLLACGLIACKLSLKLP